MVQCLRTPETVEKERKEAVRIPADELIRDARKSTKKPHVPMKFHRGPGAGCPGLSKTNRKP
jgi:hypothetical protein